MDAPMIFTLAWRNIWRHKRRTIIIVLAACGCIALVAWASCILTKCEDEARGMCQLSAPTPPL